MLILLGLVTVIYLFVATVLLFKACNCNSNNGAFAWFAGSLAWLIMVPAVCTEIGIYIFT